MSNYAQQEDGTWGPSEAIEPSKILKLENWFRRKGWQRVANLLAAWDERGLG